VTPRLGNYVTVDNAEAVQCSAREACNYVPVRPPVEPVSRSEELYEDARWRGAPT